MTALTAPLSRRTFVRWRTSAAPTDGPTDAPELTSSAPGVATSAEYPAALSDEVPSEASAPVAVDDVPAPEPPARGGVFSGTKAQIRLTPSTAATHPTSGRRGDLFVDRTGRLWFCRSGGRKATWKLVKLV